MLNIIEHELYQKLVCKESEVQGLIQLATHDASAELLTNLMIHIESNKLKFLLRDYVVKHHNFTQELLLQRFTLNPRAFYLKLPNLPLALFDLIFNGVSTQAPNRYTEFQKFALASPDCPAVYVNHVLTQEYILDNLDNHHLWLRAIAHPNCDPRKLKQKLAEGFKHTESFFFHALANPHCPPQLLQEMFEKPEHEYASNYDMFMVRTKVLSNPSCPPAIVNAAALNPDYVAVIAKHPALSPGNIQRLWLNLTHSSTDSELELALLTNPNCPQELLLGVIVQDTTKPWLADIALNNSELSLKCVLAALHHPDPQVRMAARYHPKARINLFLNLNLD